MPLHVPLPHKPTNPNTAPLADGATTDEITLSAPFKTPIAAAYPNVITHVPNDTALTTDVPVTLNTTIGINASSITVTGADCALEASETVVDQLDGVQEVYFVCSGLPVGEPTNITFSVTDGGA